MTAINNRPPTRPPQSADIAPVSPAAVELMKRHGGGSDGPLPPGTPVVCSDNPSQYLGFIDAWVTDEEGNNVARIVCHRNPGSILPLHEAHPARGGPPPVAALPVAGGVNP